MLHVALQFLHSFLSNHDTLQHAKALLVEPEWLHIPDQIVMIKHLSSRQAYGADAWPDNCGALSRGKSN